MLGNVLLRLSGEFQFVIVNFDFIGLFEQKFL